MIAKALKLAGIGFVCGMIVGVLVAIIVGLTANGGALHFPQALVNGTGSEAGALLAQMLLSGVYGAIPMAGTVLYELDSWSLVKQAIVHYLSYTVAFMVVGTLVGWIEPNVADIGIVAGVFAVCHLIIWLIMYARYKSEVAELNELIQSDDE